MKMRSVMQHTFSRVPSAEIPRSSFDRSHGYKTTFDADYLVPIFLDEALPGDTFNLNMHAFARLATPLHPIMDNMFMDFHFFAVPYRLVWTNWERFNGAQDDPDDSTDYLIPTVTAQAVDGFEAGTLADYFGLPTEVPGIEVSELPFRAYFLIWNEWFRDQNMQNSAVVPKGDSSGGFYVDGSQLFKRGKRHDYFTSCLPWPQKGDAVSLPLGTSAPIIPDGTGIPTFQQSSGPTNLGGLEVQNATEAHFENGGSNGVLAEWNDPSLIADLNDATAATINQLRQAFAVQKLLERDARGGTRYTEIIRAHFGVVSPDARLQRPEFLGGGTLPVNINPVAQTSMTTAAVEPDETPTPQGNLAGFGTVNGRVGFTKSFTEHCIVMGFASVRSDLTYQQGIDRSWLRQTRYDFFWPALSHIGEQAVTAREIYAQGNADDDIVFGYQERYGEYRYKPSRITGLFRSNHANSLDSWHLSQNFGSRPILDNAFIESNTPVDRVIAVPSEPHFIFDSYFDFKCARPMPLFGVPGFIDRF